ncbi:8583_t:CDS:2 [Funneliformis mosseae]|uniref:8583_t:CDS:1 n=1 Tax=Funneliformis mosseae TaxID=27381 RepID=A0A9N9G682_FUNMO|nr:8583_t:CDS:2 [Funneliformis mosseae]
MGKFKQPKQPGFYHVYDLKCNIHATDVKVAPPAPPLPPNPNKVINFGESNSDEDLVYGSGYIFYHKIEFLLNNSNKSRLAERNMKEGTKNIPRRQNSWILYRRDKSADPKFLKMKSSEVSKEIQAMWAQESIKVKEIFVALSRLATKKHIEKHGKNYRYRPKRTKQKEEDHFESTSEASRTNSPTTSRTSDSEENQNFFPPQINNFPPNESIELDCKKISPVNYNFSLFYHETVLQNPISFFSTNFLNHNIPNESKQQSELMAVDYIECTQEVARRIVEMIDEVAIVKAFYLSL